MVKRTQERVDNLFTGISGSVGMVDLKTVCKMMWMSLTNSVSVVDLAGVFTVSIPGVGSDVLTGELFHEFFRAFSRLKYPTGTDFCEKMLDELRSNRGQKINSEAPIFSMLMDKASLRILLKYDLSLRKAFSNFCGQSIRVGGTLSWDEVKSMSIGMEVSTI